MLNLAFLVVYFFAADFFSGEELLYVFTLHLSICVISHLSKKNTTITPIFIYYLGLIIVNVANITLIHKVATGQNKTYTYIIPRYVFDATQIWCVASTLFIIGYNWIKERSLPSIALELTKKQVLKNLFWFLIAANILSIIGYGINLRGNQVGKIFGLLNSVSILFFARLWSSEDSKTYRNYALILFVIETYIALVSSFLRFELILPTFYLFAGYFIGKGSVKYVFSYRVLPLAAIVLLYASVFSSLKNNRLNFINAFTDKSARQENPDETSGGLLDRSANLAQMTNVVNLVKKNGFYNGAASEPLLTALVPRALWPEKPLIQLGTWFALEIGVAYKMEGGRANNSVNMTVPGELYLDFGWPGVLIGSLLFGAFFALLWNATKFYSSANNVSGTIFGGYLFVLSIGGYGDLQIALTLTSTYLIFYFLRKILRSYKL